MPVYFFGVFCAPKLVLEKLEKLQRRFFWTGSDEGRFLSTAKWQQLQLSRDKGGLGIGSLSVKNMALLTKWLWRFATEEDSLWKQVIVSIHGATSDNMKGIGGRIQRGSVWYELVHRVMGDPTASTIVKENMVWRVGDGCSIRFWEDKWINHESLRVLYPRLYRVSTQIGWTLAQVGNLVGNIWEWLFTWRRQLFDREERVLDQVKEGLLNARGNAHSPDCWRWSLSDDGVYSTGSFRKKYEAAVCGPLIQLGSVWRGLAIPKAELHTWFALQGKLNVRHRLVQIGMLTIDRDKCPFCGVMEETVDHVLLLCSFVWRLWGMVLRWWGMVWCISNGLMSMYETWMGVRMFGVAKKLWQSLFYVVVWSVWKERNEVVFNQKEIKWEEVEYLVKLRLGFWVRLWCTQFPYSPSEVVRNIEGVRTWRPTRLHSG